MTRLKNGYLLSSLLLNWVAGNTTTMSDIFMTTLGVGSILSLANPGEFFKRKILPLISPQLLSNKILSVNQFQKIYLQTHLCLDAPLDLNPREVFPNRLHSHLHQPRLHGPDYLQRQTRQFIRHSPCLMYCQLQLEPLPFLIGPPKFI